MYLAHQIQYASQFISIPREIDLNCLAGFKPPLVKIINCLASRFPNIYPSRKTIEQETCTSHQHVNYYIKWLHDYGFIKIGKNGKVNQYFLCVPSIEELKEKSKQFLDNSIYAFSKRQINKTFSRIEQSQKSPSQKKFTQNNVGLNLNNEGFFCDDVGLNTHSNRAFPSPQSNNISNINKSNNVEVVEENKPCAKNKETCEKKAHIHLSPDTSNTSPIENLSPLATTEQLNIMHKILQTLENIQTEIKTLKQEIHSSNKTIETKQNHMLEKLSSIENSINIPIIPVIDTTKIENIQQEPLTEKEKHRQMNALQRSGLIPTNDNYLIQLDKFNLQPQEIDKLLKENTKFNHQDIHIALIGFKIKAAERFNNFITFKQKPQEWKQMTGREKASRPLMHFSHDFKNYLLNGYLDSFIQNARNSNKEKLANGKVKFWNENVSDFTKGKTLTEQMAYIDNCQKHNNSTNNQTVLTA